MKLVHKKLPKSKKKQKYNVFMIRYVKD